MPIGRNESVDCRGRKRHGRNRLRSTLAGRWLTGLVTLALRARAGAGNISNSWAGARGLLAICGVIAHDVVPAIGAIAVTLSAINGSINLWQLYKSKRNRGS